MPPNWRSDHGLPLLIWRARLSRHHGDAAAEAASDMSAGHHAGSEAQFRRYILFELPYFLRRKTPQKLLSIIRRWSRSGRRRIVFRCKQRRTTEDLDRRSSRPHTAVSRSKCTDAVRNVWCERCQKCSLLICFWNIIRGKVTKSTVCNIFFLVLCLLVLISFFCS